MNNSTGNSTVDPTSTDYEYHLLYPILSIFLLNFIMFFVAVYKKNNGIADTLFGFHCIILNGIILLENHNFNTRTILCYTLACIWGLRISLYVALRPSEGEDSRYK